MLVSLRFALPSDPVLVLLVQVLGEVLGEVPSEVPGEVLGEVPGEVHRLPYLAEAVFEQFCLRLLLMEFSNPKNGRYVITI